MRKGLTQGELARLLKTDKSAVSHWERGDFYPAPAKLPEVARILETSIDELFRKDGENK